MKLAVLLVLSTLTAAYGYRILCVQGVPTRSHYNLVKGIVNALLEVGHEVTMITPYPDSKPVKNLHFIDVSPVTKVLEGLDLTDRSKMGFAMVKSIGRQISSLVLETPEVKVALIKSNFDAVVTEWFFSDVDAGFAAVQQVPWILLSTTVMQPHMEYLVDTVRSTPLIPFLMNDSPLPMTFKTRVLNSFWYIVTSVSHLLELPQIDIDYQNHFEPLAKARGVALPPFSEALYNISVMLVNSHTSFAPAQSLPPNVVDIAGYHIDEHVPPLPKDLQDLLDRSKQGVIYFSMGSSFKSSAFPEKTKTDLVKLFGKLPYTVLWKLEEPMSNLPKNLHIKPWMPQSSILSHPNVKTFITHGGLLSTLESLQFGVPIIAIPVYGDQPINAARAVRAGNALKVELTSNLAEDLGVALKEMLSNNSYHNQAKFQSSLFRNRPVPPKKLIQYYVELAIESKGAYHLRSKTHLYKWYEIWMLDQLALIMVVLFSIYKVTKLVLSKLFCKKKENKPKKQKKH